MRVSATPGADLAVNKAQSFLRATFRSQAISVEKRFDFACDGSMCQDLTKALSIFQRCIIRRCGRLVLWKTCSLCGNFQVELGSDGATDKSSNYWVCSRWLYTIVTETANINRLYWGNLSEQPLSVSLNRVGFFLNTWSSHGPGALKDDNLDSREIHLSNVFTMAPPISLKADDGGRGGGVQPWLKAAKSLCLPKDFCCFTTIGLTKFSVWCLPVVDVTALPPVYFG